MTKIEWADKTINPIVGCSKISEGCQNCYAITAANSARLGQLERYQKVRQWDGTLEFIPSVLEQVAKRRQPTTYFVCSMSDLFHDNVEPEWREQIFQAFIDSPQHNFLLLTKRSRNMMEFSKELNMLLPNVWWGVTIESQKLLGERLGHLNATLAHNKFISFEPLLSAIDLKSYFFKNIRFCIIGGESGQNARPCDLAWMRSLSIQLKQRKDMGVFIKQLGSNCFLSQGQQLDIYGNSEEVRLSKEELNIKSRKGDLPKEFPRYLRFRELPYR